MGGDLGQKVVLFERDLKEQDRIVGELLQPGGLRSLERLGIDDCAKTECDSIPVHGYAIFQGATTENSNPGSMLLSYPQRDPENFKEYFGCIESNCEENSINHNTMIDESRDMMRNFDAIEETKEYFPTENEVEGMTNIRIKSDKEDKVHLQDPIIDSNVEGNPLGRSFHNSRFVQNLRHRAMLHPNVTIIQESCTNLLGIKKKKMKTVGVQYTYEEHPPNPNENKDGMSDDLQQKTCASNNKRKGEMYAPLTIVADGIWSSL